MKGFGSDNHAGVHPELLKALLTCNENHEPSYGTDKYTQEAIQHFKKQFGSQIEVYFCFNGTAANVLSLGFLCERHESIICSEASHINVDECGAPELFAGKLVPVKHIEGKISLSSIEKLVVRKGDQHFSQVRAISLTQPTELGTCYSLNEIKEICDWAHQNQLYVHLDGARLTNALIELNCTFKEMTTDLGVDIVSFGGTKNGFMMGEAIVIINPKLAQESKQQFRYLRKQAMQLPSKTRYIAAQFSRYFQDELYLKIAKHSCMMAERLDLGLKDLNAFEFTAKRQSNAVFIKIPREIYKSLKEKYFFYVWDENTYECRIMISWDTTSEEVDDFIQLAKNLLQSHSELSKKVSSADNTFLINN